MPQPTAAWPWDEDEHKQAALVAERSGYAATLTKKKVHGWNDMTQYGSKHTMFDGLQARPYTSQLAGTPMTRARSGARSVDPWQRDYNTKGLIMEKVTSLRYQKVVEMRKKAQKEAERRKLPVEVVEEEMYQAQSAASKRIDTGIRKIEMSAPCRTTTSGGGPPRLFDGNEKLEEDFDLYAARDMFRGEAWDLMSETLKTIEEFKPPARSDKKRGSCHPVSPAEAKAAEQKKKKTDQIGAADLSSLKKLLIRKYGGLWQSWRNCLASDGVNQLSFAQWSKAMRSCGFEGNVKAVWKQLDDDNSGLISIAELCGHSAAKMRSFQEKVLAKYGPTWEDVWRVIDADHSNQVDQDEFEEVCASVGYEGDAHALYKILRSHPSRKFLNLEDFTAIPKNI